MPTAFVCHSGKDKDFARRLAKRLSDLGVTVWIDEEGLNIGDSLIQKISDAIEKTDYVLAVLSPNSVESNWVQKELQMAMTKEIKGKKVVVLPLLLANCRLPAYLDDKMHADFRRMDNFEPEIRKILRAMSIQYREEPSKPSAGEVVDLNYSPPVRVPVQEFEDIVIIGIDKSGVHKIERYRDLYRVPFILSSIPPPEWCQIFENERRFPRHSMWQKAYVEGDKIIVECGLDEAKRYHAADIKQDVTNTNLKYRDYLTEIARRRAKEIGERQREQKRIDEELGGIEF